MSKNTQKILYKINFVVVYIVFIRHIYNNIKKFWKVLNMLLIKRGNIDEVFIHKDNFYGEKSIFASCKKNDSIHTEKSYSYVLGIALALSAFIDMQNKNK